MSYRPELKEYIGKRVLMTATLSERSGGRAGYGYLLEEIELPNGEVTDHFWVGGGEGVGCVRWPNGTACLGHEIRFIAHVHTYTSEGAIRHGDYGLSIGIEIMSEDEDIHVKIGDAWVPMPEAAKTLRARQAETLKNRKAAGGYIWPGRWVWSSGWKVKAAKSAKPGDLCEVRSRNGMGDETVILEACNEAWGEWTWRHTPERLAQKEKAAAEEAARLVAELEAKIAAKAAAKAAAEERKAIYKYFDPSTTDRQRKNLLKKHAGWLTPDRLAEGLADLADDARREMQDEFSSRARVFLGREAREREARDREAREYSKAEERDKANRNQAATLLKNVALPYSTGPWTLTTSGGILFHGDPTNKPTNRPPGLLVAASELLLIGKIQGSEEPQNGNP